MPAPLATVVPQPANLLGEITFAVLVRSPKGTTVAGIFSTRRDAEDAAAALNPTPRRPKPAQPRLFAF